MAGTTEDTENMESRMEDAGTGTEGSARTKQQHKKEDTFAARPTIMKMVMSPAIMSPSNKWNIGKGLGAANAGDR